MQNIERFGYKIGIQFNKSVLVTEQNNYGTKIVYAYIAYYLDNWPRNPPNNFTLTNCLFRATNIVKNSDRSQSDPFDACDCTRTH